jgi:CxxC motif-containing protein/thioredoxin reductase
MTETVLRGSAGSCGDLDAFDLVVIGGGPAGLAAAVCGARSGLAHVVVLEREGFLGGVLPQCIHDGFGLHLYHHPLTGPEYAEVWREEVAACGAATALDTTVLGVHPGHDGLFTVEAVGAPLGGRREMKTRSVVVATGCRERTRGQLSIPGTRPAGIITAGCAQYMVNVKDQLPGDKVVILGSGDIGLIMARRLTLEGAEVRLVLGQEAMGLVRNHIRCIHDFGIPIRYGWGLVSVHGSGQLKGVMVAPFLEDGSFDLARREYVRCNALVIACGLIPEREVIAGLDSGVVEGLFVCGNASAPHDLADQVTQEGLRTGRAAATYVHGRRGTAIPPVPEDIARLLDIDVVEPKGRVSELPSGEGRERAVVCTVCPTGCVMEVALDGVVTGNGCRRGEEYAHAEMVRPLRLFTGTVRLRGGDGRLLPVRTRTEVSRDALCAVAKACRHVHAQAPVTLGDVVRADVAGTGVDLVATASAGPRSFAHPLVDERGVEHVI